MRERAFFDPSRQGGVHLAHTVSMLVVVDKTRRDSMLIRTLYEIVLR
jgi:hypothetical protein